ncbi:glycosyltransferase family 39 protein [Thermococcus sp.]|uniref:glycosyltransferase family 39 protein n=1 Tax=Thermococcus sp. TaxID=35749 RepID=UPI00260AE6DC|nr:glycosyltransferase family 39 protein [Thermococcus sp.]
MEWKITYGVFPLILVVAVTATLKSIPGPPYGGDLYFHNGIAEAIYRGTFLFHDPTNLHGYAFYPWSYHLIVSLLAHPFGDTIPVTVHIMPPLILLLSMTGVYLLVKEVTNRNVALLSVGLPLALVFPEPHPHVLLQMVMLPLSFWALARYLKRPSTHNGIIVGITWGLSGLTHVLGTFGLGAILLVNAAWDFIQKPCTKTIEQWLTPLLTGTLILMLYWGPLLFVYHGRTLNPYQSLVMAHYTLLDFTWGMLTFFVSYSWKAVLSLVVLFGFYSMIKGRKVLAFRLLASSVVGLFLVGVVFILLGDPLISYKMHLYYFTLTVLLSSLGFERILLSSNRVERSFAVVAIILLLLSTLTVSGFVSNKWTQNGFEEFPFENLQKWILSNTSPNDVILSNYESSFMIFSISGRKTVLFRRTHASPFVDYNRRSADMMVALLGDNTTKSLELLKSYHVRYIYIDGMTAKDPLWVPFSYKEYLVSHGVPCKVEWVRYDPADPESTKIKACVANFSVSRILTYLKVVYKDNWSTIFEVEYPSDSTNRLVYKSD